MVIPWKEEYTLGIASIDEQHKKLIGIIDTLAKNISQGLSEGDVISAIVRMEQYAKEHLLYEEKCFAACDYEKATGHMASHHVFLEKIKAFRERARVNDPLLSVEMLGYLEEWFLHHVQVEDRLYVETFKKCGIR